MFKIIPMLLGVILLFFFVWAGIAIEKPQAANPSTDESNIQISSALSENTPEATQIQGGILPATLPTQVPTTNQTPRKILLGVFLPTFPPERNLDAFENLVGRKLDLITWHQNWKQPGPTEKLAICQKRGLTPVITWESWNGRSEGGNPFPIQEIASGKYDSLIRSNLISISQTYTGTLYIRFDHEMNTPPGEVLWYPWQGDPENYKLAFQKVVSIGHEVNPNIKWIWAPAWANENASLYFPGDQYVDYVGLTVLNFWQDKFDLRLKWIRWRSFSDLYEPQRPVLLGFNKPVIITEVATGEGARKQDKADWITEMFYKAKFDYPEITGILWSNSDHAREFPDIKWRIDSSQESLDAFKKAVKEE